MQNKKLYKFVDKDGKEHIGSVVECVGYEVPTYEVFDNTGFIMKGKMSDISEKLGIHIINLYNYTRHARKSDGLFLTKVDYEVVIND